MMMRCEQFVKRTSKRVDSRQIREIGNSSYETLRFWHSNGFTEETIYNRRQL